MSEDVAAAKTALRQNLVAARRAMDTRQRHTARTAIRSAVMARCASLRWQCVAAYVPLRTEPGSVELLDDLYSTGVRVLVPITLTDRDLDWAGWMPSGIGSALGVDAVGDADAVLSPALAVASDGTRLGRGGGSYDRALARCRPGIPIAALVFDDEVLARLPRDSWDRPVTAAVSPGGWVDLAGNTGVASDD